MNWYKQSQVNAMPLPASEQAINAYRARYGDDLQVFCGKYPLVHERGQHGMYDPQSDLYVSPQIVVKLQTLHSNWLSDRIHTDKAEYISSRMRKQDQQPYLQKKRDQLIETQKNRK